MKFDNEFTQFKVLKKEFSENLAINQQDKKKIYKNLSGARHNCRDILQMCLSRESTSTSPDQGKESNLLIQLLYPNDSYAQQYQFSLTPDLGLFQKNISTVISE